MGALVIAKTYQNTLPRMPGEVKLEDFRAALLAWFDEHGKLFSWRRANTSEYETIIAELLLQRTRRETVDAFLPVFIDKFPAWADLVRVSTPSLQAVLRPIGLWRRRAVTFRKLATAMVTLKGGWPTDREAIEALPGVGQYMANAIELFCHGRPRPLLDSNVARVLERCFGPRVLADIRYDPYLQALAMATVNCSNSIRINWAMLDLAAAVCAPKGPRCLACPLQHMCKHAGRVVES